MAHDQPTGNNNPFQQQSRIPGVKHIIAVGSGKGGVGKSSVAANLAMALHQNGLKTGLLDADIYGPSVPRLFGALQQKPEILANGKIAPLRRLGISLMSMGFLIDDDQAVVWRGPMLFKVMDQFFRDVAWGELDVLVVDLPPGTGDVALTLAQKVPVTAALAVTTPQNMSLMDVRRAVDMFAKLGIPLLGVIENMAGLKLPGQEAKIDLFPRGDLKVYLETNHLKLLASLPFDPMLGIASEAGVPLVEAQPQSDVAVALKQVAQVIAELP